MVTDPIKEAVERANSSGLLTPTLFERAAALVDERGWFGMKYPDPGGANRITSRVCVVNAIMEAVDELIVVLVYGSLPRLPDRRKLTRVREVQLRDDLWTATSVLLQRKLNVSGIGSVFAANDAQLESEGADWAGSVLRHIAHDLR